MESMSLIKMSSKGQIVIPSAMRQDLNEGEEFIIVKDGGRFVIKKAGFLTEKMRDDLEFAKRTEEAWKEIEEGKYTECSTEEFFNRIKDGD